MWEPGNHVILDWDTKDCILAKKVKEMAPICINFDIRYVFPNIDKSVETIDECVDIVDEYTEDGFKWEVSKLYPTLAISLFPNNDVPEVIETVMGPRTTEYINNMMGFFVDYTSFQDIVDEYKHMMPDDRCPSTRDMCEAFEEFVETVEDAFFDAITNGYDDISQYFRKVYTDLGLAYHTALMKEMIQKGGHMHYDNVYFINAKSAFVYKFPTGVSIFMPEGYKQIK